MMSASENVKKNQLIQVVALALQDSRTREFMLAKRSVGSGGAGEWEFPGGKIEGEETQQQALVREINEELKFDLSPFLLEYVGENVHAYPAKSIQIFLWKLSINFKPQFILSDHDCVDWFHLDKIEEINLSKADNYFISLLK